MTFEELALSEAVKEAVRKKGYETPTPVQAAAIPLALEGKDLIGTAQTGTGKTAAFALPTLSRLSVDGKIRCLAVVPTRELAVQVAEQFETYAGDSGLRVALVYGGVGYDKQIRAIEAGAQIVVATPGRLLDHISQKNISLKDLQVLVLDEVDRMLDLGFIEDVRRIVSYCPKQRQTLLFSATMPEAIRKLADKILTEPVLVEIGARQSPAETVDHAIFPIDAMQKLDLLVAMLEKMDYKSVLIFTRTKRDADRITEWLQGHDHPVTTMHADRSQSERARALKGFKSGEFPLMVATDVASRGLDISGITHVINYNVPEHAEDYVHRIGRTGRASTEGEAFTLYSNNEFYHLQAIERFINMTIPRRRLEGFAYRREPDLGSSSQSEQSVPVQRPRGRRNSRRSVRR